jgi:hypothetical protein
MNMSTAERTIGAAVAIETLTREVMALTVVHQTRARQSDAGLLCHQPKGELHGTLGFVARPRKF